MVECIGSGEGDKELELWHFKLFHVFQFSRIVVSYKANMMSNRIVTVTN